MLKLVSGEKHQIYIAGVTNTADFPESHFCLIFQVTLSTPLTTKSVPEITCAAIVMENHMRFMQS